jgi:hypothetical protein
VPAWPPGALLIVDAAVPVFSLQPCAEHVSDFEVHYDSDKRILLTIKGRVGNAALVEYLPGPANINQDVALLRLNARLQTASRIRPSSVKAASRASTA